MSAPIAEIGASAEAVDRFLAWARTEAGAHYAEPCPNEVMNALVDTAHQRLEELVAVPAANADELVLKLFPFVLQLFEPPRNSPPLLPALGDGLPAWESVLAAVIADMASLSPAVREVMAIPHPRTFERGL